MALSQSIIRLTQLSEFTKFKVLLIGMIRNQGHITSYIVVGPIFP